MSIKKELLDELSEQQLRDLAAEKEISMKLNTIRKKFYHGWDEKEKLVDMMADKKELTVSDIQTYIQEKSTSK